MISLQNVLEWNSHPEITSVAEKLYGDIEYLGLYVGLQAEEAKFLIDGAGLCPGAELDRLHRGAFMIVKGIQKPLDLAAHWVTFSPRTLPNHFTEDNVYTFFPFHEDRIG